MSGHPAATGLSAHTQRRFLLGLVLLTLFAWLLREYFVAVTIVEAPIRGDIRQYVAYAWNLLHHGIFSHVWPGSGTPVPDDFRGPGYPAFLAACMWLGDQGWYQLSLHAQAVLGALTATVTALLARHWLSRAWSLFAGALVALWPHHVAATGALLGEVVFGFLLVCALWLVAEALKRRSTAWAAAAGIAFSAAALTSMVSLLFPLAAAWVCWRASGARLASVLLLCALAGPAAWEVRNATIPPAAEPGRIALNIVQGSWPQYHAAYASRNASPIAKDIMRAIGEEERLLADHPVAGLQHMAGRMERDATYYASWYFLRKPFLLWDWDIRMGAGDVYFHRVSHSPLEGHPVLRAAKAAMKALNPAIFAISALASLVLLVAALRGKPGWIVAGLVGGFCVYATLVHVLFQAEPRYAIPYRPMQLLVLATVLSWAVTRVRSRIAGDH